VKNGMVGNPMDTKPDPVYPNAKTTSSFQDGMEFQDFVCTELAKQNIILQNLSSKKWQYNVGENLQGFEIKFDSVCTKSERLSIEIFEKSKAENQTWIKSGILREDNSWIYIQGNYDILFVFAKNFLIRFFELKKPEVQEKFGTIKTFYLPFNFAKLYAAKTIDLRKA